VALEFPQPRYLPFGFYPVREFAPLLVTAADLFYPDLSLRQGLRRIGTAGLAFLSSTLGKVTLGASEGVHATVAAIAETYGINTATPAPSGDPRPQRRPPPPAATPPRLPRAGCQRLHLYRTYWPLLVTIFEGSCTANDKESLANGRRAGRKLMTNNGQ
jgi:hypothetical protein